MPKITTVGEAIAQLLDNREVGLPLEAVAVELESVDVLVTLPFPSPFATAPGQKRWSQRRIVISGSAKFIPGSIIKR